jgi:hypothetical protein
MSPTAHENDSPTLMLPSNAYNRNRSTLIYTLSEAVFASLLAAYLVGFASSISGVKIPDSYVALPWLGMGLKLLLLIQLALVSLSFALLTTSLYIKYHMAILTMPTYNLDKLLRDFFFAVFPAIGFGFCLYCPPMLVAFVVFLLVFGIYIQRTEAERLTAKLREKLNPGFVTDVKNNNPVDYTSIEYDRQLDTVIQKELIKEGFNDWVVSDGHSFPEWLSWIPKFSHTGVTLLGAGGILVVLIAIFVGSEFFSSSWWWIILFVIVNGWITYYIFHKSRLVIEPPGGGGRFLERLKEKKEFDKAFERVQQALANYHPTQKPKD